MPPRDDPDRLKREIDRYERELEAPISPDRRRAIQGALAHCKQKLRDWGRRRGAMSGTR